MSGNSVNTVGRRAFLRRLMLEGALTYGQACRAHACFVSVLSDAVVNGDRVGFGRLGCLAPVRRAARDVVMGFAWKNKKMLSTKRVFHVGERVEFKFRLYHHFVKKHDLKG